MSPINALIGLTGVDEADSGSKNAATRLGTGLAMAQGRGPAVGKVVSVSDPDDEVRTVVRSVVGLLDQGMAAGEIAILYPHKLPYRRLLEEYLNKSGVSFNGLSSRSIANSMLGRFIATLLALPDSNLQVDEVLEFLASSHLLRRRGEEAVVRQSHGHKQPYQQEFMQESMTGRRNFPGTNNSFWLRPARRRCAPGITMRLCGAGSKLTKSPRF